MVSGSSDDERVVMEEDSIAKTRLQPMNDDSQNGDEEAHVVSKSSGELSAGGREISEENFSINEERQKKLTGQLMKLLEHSGGSLDFNRICHEYDKLFGGPLCVSEYGASNLAALLQKFSCGMVVKGEGAKRRVYLNTVNDTPLSSPSPETDKEERGKVIQGVNADAHLVSGSSEDKRVIMEEDQVVKKRRTINIHKTRVQLVKLLGQSGGCLPLSQIPQEYEKFSGQPLCLLDCGVCNLMDLLQKYPYAMTIEDEGANKVVYLKYRRARISTMQARVANNTLSSLSLGKDKEGGEEDMHAGNEDVHSVSKSIDKSSDKLFRSQEEVREKLIKLLEYSEGFIAMQDLPGQYKKLFGQVLLPSEYGYSELAALLQNFSSVITVKGAGAKKRVYLKNYQTGTVHDIPLSSPSPNTDKEGGGKGVQDVNEDAHLVSKSSDKGELFEMRKEVRGKLIKLLEYSGGFLSFNDISVEYKKLFGHHLCVSDYGVGKLATLLKKFKCVMTVTGAGAERCVHLKNYQAGTVHGAPLSSPSPNTDKEGGGKGVQDVNEDAHLVSEPLDESSDQRELFERQMEVKEKLIKLLEYSGGFLAFNDLTGEYRKFFGQNLCVREYGVSKLATLLKKFECVMTVTGVGAERRVCLKNYEAGTVNGMGLSSPSLSTDKEGGGNGVHDVNENAHLVSVISDNTRAVTEMNSIAETRRQNMQSVKRQLLGLLGQSGGCLPLSHIPQEYEKLFRQPLCPLECGAYDLMMLLQRFSDVMTIVGEGADKVVQLKASGARTADNTLPAPLHKEKKRRRRDNGNEDAHLVSRSSDVSSNGKREILEDLFLEERRLNTLRRRLTKLLKQSGGFLDFDHISEEFHKLFGHQLCVSEYGASDLMALLQKCIFFRIVEGTDARRLVYLKNTRADAVNGPPLSGPSLSNDKEGERNDKQKNRTVRRKRHWELNHMGFGLLHELPGNKRAAPTRELEKLSSDCGAIGESSQGSVKVV